MNQDPEDELYQQALKAFCSAISRFEDGWVEVPYLEGFEAGWDAAKEMLNDAQ